MPYDSSPDEPHKEPERSAAPLPVIGIGASAGGLDALKRLLAAIDRPPDAAIVVVQHMDPTHRSMLASLLDRQTGLKVQEAAREQRLRAGTIYIIPPGKYLEMSGRRLVVTEPPEARFQRSPIDHFFRSQARAGGERAIGIILSGTGSDGVQGLREIKAAGGVALAQEPGDAEFDGMPLAAMESGLVDFVVPVEEMPRRIATILEQAEALNPAQVPDLAEHEPDHFAAILDLVAREVGYDFQDYKPGTLNRRIQRRMALNRAADLAAYRRVLEENPRELEILTKDLLIGVTRFFRDRDSWEALARHVADPLIERLPAGGTLRAWVPGCATGEEAYTLGMVLLERIDRSGRELGLQIFATDLNQEAIVTARAGRYPAGAAADIPAPRYEPFFDIAEDRLQIAKRLREKIVFAAQNATTDPPFSKLDLITCRNLLIYLDLDAQSRMVETLHFALKEGGYLMLGLSESVDRAKELFEPRLKRHRIYRRQAGSGRRPPRLHRADRASRNVPVPEPSAVQEPRLPVDRVVRAMLARFAPPAVLVDEDFAFASFHGDLTPYLRFRAGVMTGNIVGMAAEPLQPRLWSALQACRRNGEATESVVSAVLQDGRLRTVRILVEPVARAAAGQHYLVYFLDMSEAAAPPPDAAQDTAGADAAGDAAGDMVGAGTAEQFMAELEATRHELAEVIERAESSNEALQAANEEVMSANEELQSSNQELETSREELQSLNEELTTINSELEDKVSELEATNDDLANLISSSDIATIFLDTDLCIRRFSDRTRHLMRIVDSDIGRPLADFALRVDDDCLLDDARAVIERLEPVEAEVQDGEDRSYLRRVTPYRTRDDRIDGVVVTYADVTRLRQTAQQLQAQASRQVSVAELGELALGSEDLPALLDRAAAEVAEQLGMPFVEIQALDPDGAHLTLVAGAGWARGLVGNTRTPVTGRSHAGYALHRPGPLTVTNFSQEKRFRRSALLRDHDIRCGLTIPVGPPGRPWGLLGAYNDADCAFLPEDLTYLQSIANILWLAVSQDEARQARQEEHNALRQLMDGLPMMIGVVGPDLHFELCNSAFETLGWTPPELEGVTVAEAFGPEAFGRAEPALLQALNGESAHVEVALRPPGASPRTYLLHATPRGGPKGLEGLFLAAVDISDRKRAEEHNQVISAELDHRVKNILALVNTIARMTARRAGSIDEFKAMFEARIDSLARTHMALAEAHWTGASLRNLVDGEFAAYAEPDDGRISIEGPDIRLAMRPTQTLALAFHELTTNAAKYGALSRPEGRLSVKWWIDGDSFTLEWHEDPGTKIAKPESNGFGTRVLQAVVADQLKGKARLSFRKDGLLYRFTCAADTLTATAETRNDTRNAP